MGKKTLIIGASEKPERYAYLAAERLTNHGHPIKLIGNREGILFGEKIQTDHPEFDDIDTVTLYLSAKYQPEYYDYVIGLNPKRVIFNPGTENAEFEAKLEDAGIEPLEACTLVMLSTDQF